MRISSSQIFAQGVSRILDLQRGARDLQNQVASGKRVMQPGDDPVAATAVQQIAQQINANQQYDRNGVQAEQRLNQVDDVLGGVNSIVQSVRDLALQGRSESLGASDRGAIAQQIRQQLDALVELGNSRNAAGEYIFAGAAVAARPFTSNEAGAVTYNGDQVARELQVSASRTLADGFTGQNALMEVRNGNGTFVTRMLAGNTGTAQISDNVVVNGTAYLAHDFRISFTSATTYDIIDNTLGATVAAAQPYVDGAAIGFNGSSVTVFGTPAAGDQFTAKPSQHQSMFQTLDTLATTLATGFGNPSAQAAFGFNMDRALEDIDQALGKTSVLRSAVGARLNSITAQSDVNVQAKINLEALRSKLEDVDLSQAISALSQETLSLQAAEQSFVKIQGLSLFNYIQG